MMVRTFVVISSGMSFPTVLVALSKVVELEEEPGEEQHTRLACPRELPVET